MGRQRSTTAEFIVKARKVHGKRYNYGKVDYKSGHTKVIITCTQHGDFQQEPGHHLTGQGCPACDESHGETAIRLLLKINNIKYAAQHRIKECRNSTTLPFDFAVWIGGRLHLIEYHGEQHYRPNGFFGGQRAFDAGRCVDRLIVETHQHRTRRGLEAEATRPWITW